MDSLGRFYTKDIVSDLLVQNLISQFPAKILDLGIGNASLTIAAHKRWNKAKYFATEIENHKVKEIENKLNFINIFKYDSLKPNLSKKLNIRYGSIDLAICNPPYTSIKEKEQYSELLYDADCIEFLKLKRLTSEIIFFAHNLTLLKNNGELGIIVSDSLVTGKEYSLFREVLLKKFNLRSIIQLPDNIFSKTEARTHILFLSKSKSSSNKCSLYSSDKNGILTNKIDIQKSNLVARMDYQFHLFFRDKFVSTKTLKDIDAIIKRGSFSNSELKCTNLPSFHSNNFKDHNSVLSFHKKVYNKYSEYSANPGDILLCRVGKRCVGKLAFIKSGSVIISDCIYKISVSKKYQKVVWNSLTSQQGKAWLHAYAHGVCSQVISKSDLINFPIFKI